VHELARGLGPEQTVHLLQQHGMHGEDLPPSVEGMAADHLRRLSRVSPEGALYLGGHCAGAVIALEMARQLAAQGRCVTSLLLVEPPLSGTSEGNAAPRPLRLSPELRRLPRIRATWLFAQYRAIVARYRCPGYRGTAAVFWAQDARRTRVRFEARTVLTQVAPQIETYSCPGTHISVLGRHVRDVADAMKRHISLTSAPALRLD
jgi:thioesterase domain-containing protein